MPQIILENPSLGGIADSAYLGPANSLAAMVGLDIHSEPGIMKVNQKMTKESGSNIDALVNQMVVASDGNTYMFLGNGKIFQRTSGAVYTLKCVVAPSVGAAGILDAREYQGYIYYATQNKLGRKPFPGLSDWSDRDDNYASFTNGNATYHPMSEINLVLYIGDGNFLAQVDNIPFTATGTISTSGGTAVVGVGTLFTTQAKIGGRISFIDANGVTQVRTITAITDNLNLTINSAFTVTPSAKAFKLAGHNFTSNALDIKEPLIVESLGQDGVELLLGTFINAAVNDTEVIRWNTWSPSFSSSDPVAEVGVSSFLQTDNFILAIAGTKGNIYQYTGDQLQQIKRIPGDWSGANRATVTLNASANRAGLPLFGLSNVNGNPALQGVYSFGHNNPSYPQILNLEHVLSPGSSGMTIGAMTFLGGSGATADTLLVAWFDGANYGVDALDNTAKATGSYIDSRIITNDRNQLKRLIEIQACYRNLPTNCDFKFYVSKNHGAFTEIADKTSDTDRQYIKTNVSVDDCVTYQVRVEFVVSGNTAPDLEKVIINL